MTERKVQDILIQNHRKKSLVLIPNIYLYGKNESDLIKIDYRDIVTEFEIKTSREDFYADSKKEEKHNNLKHLYDLTLLPNYFNYVLPEGTIGIEEAMIECPDYAGLFFVCKFKTKIGHYLKKIVYPRMLHNEKMDPDKWKKIAQSLYHRQYGQNRRT